MVAQDERGVGGDESFSESLSKDVFSTYKCRSIKHGIEHPGDIAEASGLRYEPLSPSKVHALGLCCMHVVMHVASNNSMYTV
jgi:hypothetical protein